MVLIRDLTIQGAQMLLVLFLAPLFTGFVRAARAYRASQLPAAAGA